MLRKLAKSGDYIPAIGGRDVKLEARITHVEHRTEHLDGVVASVENLAKSDKS